MLRNAGLILESAEAAACFGHRPAELSILLGPDGGIRIIADSDWPLDSLGSHHGARAAFRVRTRGDAVLVEGRCGAERCLIEKHLPALAGRVHRTGADGAASLELVRLRDSRSRIWWT